MACRALAAALLLFGLLFGLAGAAGAEPYLVADVQSAIVPGSSTPAHFHDVAHGVAFLTVGRHESVQLWVTDGTTDGTQHLREVESRPWAPFVEDIAVGNGLWLFSVLDALWRTDGTEAGSFLIPGTVNGPAIWVESLGAFLFAGADEAHGVELWRSDGTVDGTRRVRDLTPGVDGSAIVSIVGLEMGALVVRRAPAGDELWHSDGTASGTVKVASLMQIGLPVATFGGDAIFFARQDDGIWRLWRSDGSANGTWVLALLAPMADEDAAVIADLGSCFLFVADDGTTGQQIHRSDGTGEHTSRLTSAPGGFFPGACGPYGSTWTVSGSTAFRPLATDETGCEMWSSDGTPEGSGLEGDLCFAGCGSAPSHVTPVAGGVVFFARAEPYGIQAVFADSLGTPPRRLSKICGDHGCLPSRILALDGRAIVEREAQDEIGLFSTDGTNAGTERLADRSGSHGSYDGGPGVVRDGALLFGFDDGPSGLEPWRTDGTRAGTQMLRDIEPASTASAQAGIAVATRDRVIFSAYSGNADILDRSLWSSDGTEAGTRPVPGLPSNDSFQTTGFRPFRGGALFSADDLDPDTSGLWFTDGDASTRLAPFDRFGDLITEALDAGGRLFFVASSGAWVTDGTVIGTDRLTGPETSVPSEVVGSFGQLGDAVYFLASGAGGNGLSRTDGTPAGTRLAVEIPGLVPGVGGHFTRFGARLGFVAATVAAGNELWITDGTPAGTSVLDLVAGAGASNPDNLIAVGSRLLFETRPSSGPYALASTDGSSAGTLELSRILVHAVYGDGEIAYVAGDTASGTALLRSDGTAAGTFRLAAGPPPFHVTPFFAGELLYFVGTDPQAAEAALWRTDGTVDGTFPIVGFEARPPGFSLLRASPAGSRVVFSLHDEAYHNTLLFETSGTAADTHPIATPSSLLIDQAGFHRVGPRLFFTGSDPSHGSELWALPIEDVVAADPHALGLGPAARFEVELEWTDYAGNTGRASKAPLRSADSGLLWFFSENNWELLVKVLDACAIDGHHWVFASAATSVGYTLRVTDTATGQVKTYSNPVGRQAPPIVDTAAFATCDAGVAPALGPPSSSPALALGPPSSSPALALGLPSSSSARESASPCPPDVLCLGDGGRFHASMTWRRFDGQTGIGQPVPGTPESGLFWFFDDDNWETLVKVLDGCQITGRFWVFAASTTTVEYTLRVEDVVTGEVAEYHNPLGQAAPAITDTVALEACP